MCDTPGMTIRSEPLISRWIASAAAGGVAGSSAPTMTRVGSVMAFSRSVMLRLRMAPPQPMKPSAGVASIILESRATSSGFLRLAAASQRCMEPSGCEAMPFSRTVLMRSSHMPWPSGGTRLLVDTSIRSWTRLGCISPMYCPTMPPIDRPR